MRFEVETLDDALLKLYSELLSRQRNVTASRGDNTEILGVLIEATTVEFRSMEATVRASSISGVTIRFEM